MDIWRMWIQKKTGELLKGERENERETKKVTLGLNLQ